MAAKASTDESGVEYRFEETTGTGLFRDWGSSNQWIIMSGLSLGNTYTFKCKARDKSTAQNPTGWSDPCSVTLFAPVDVLEVPYEYPTIQAALNAAHNGDIVRIHPGTYIGTGFTINKNITVMSTNPQDPRVVAATIIDCNGEQSIGFWLNGSGGGTCSLKGLTIINAYCNPVPGPDGVNPGNPGSTGGGRAGAGIVIDGGHIVENCVVRNCTAEGGRGGNGADGGGDPGATPPIPSGAKVVVPAVEEAALRVRVSTCVRLI